METPLRQNGNRRKTLLIDPKFQMKWTGIIVSVGVIISASLGYFIVKLHSENTELLGLDQTMTAQVKQLDSYALYYLIGFVVVMAVALFLWGVFTTHRVAGPIYIISRYLEELAQGLPPQTRPLRKKDELKDFFQTFSAMVGNLRESNQKEIKVLEVALDQLRQKGGDTETINALESLVATKQMWKAD